MHSGNRGKHICIFGDSHIACIKKAVDSKLVDLDNNEVEFWGTTGNRFRHLSYKNGAIVPTDKTTTERFAKLNGQGRKLLHPDDFDMVLFMGCRIRLSDLFMDFLHRRLHPHRFISHAMQTAIVAAHLDRHSTYQFAKQFAAQNKAKILFAPVSFHTTDLADLPRNLKNAANATSKDRALLWEIIRLIMEGDGIILIPQNEGTVTKGCFTRTEFAVKNAAENNDFTHKNAEYGAGVLQDALAYL